jgi:hypothetical protein
VAAGPVVVQGGDYFGRTVNLAARLAARAGAGQVLVSQSVAEAPAPEGVTFEELAELRLAGFAQPVRALRPAARKILPASPDGAMDETTVGIGALERAPLFAGLDRDDLQQVLGCGQHVSFQPGPGDRGAG